jgi:hypothetical protein
MIFVDEQQIDNFKKRYSHLHPLIFHRSVERANNLIELFEILEGVPSKPPIIWDETSRSWIKQTDIIAQKKLKNIKK